MTNTKTKNPTNVTFVIDDEEITADINNNPELAGTDLASILPNMERLAARRLSAKSGVPFDEILHCANMLLIAFNALKERNLDKNKNPKGYLYRTMLHAGFDFLTSKSEERNRTVNVDALTYEGTAGAAWSGRHCPAAELTVDRRDAEMMLIEREERQRNKEIIARKAQAAGLSFNAEDGENEVDVRGDDTAEGTVLQKAKNGDDKKRIKSECDKAKIACGDVDNTDYHELGKKLARAQGKYGPFKHEAGERSLKGLVHQAYNMGYTKVGQVLEFLKAENYPVTTVNSVRVTLTHVRKELKQTGLVKGGWKYTCKLLAKNPTMPLHDFADKMNGRCAASSVKVLWCKWRKENGIAKARKRTA